MPKSHSNRYFSARLNTSAHRIEITEIPRQNPGPFLRVAYAIYGDDPNWVPPLLMDLATVFKDGNPLFEHAEMKLWVARRDGKDVGRVAGIFDRNHVAKFDDGTAFWGFFESIDDPAVSKLLFEQVDAWAKGLRCRRLLGPMNPTTNDECGLLVDGFDRPPVFMMTYNPRHYVPLVEGLGFTKAKDLLAYHFPVDPKPLARLTKIADGLAKRNPDIVLRKIRKKTLEADLIKVREVYNAAWEDNWGFVPMTEAEMRFMAKRLKPMLVEDFALLAEDKGVPVAFMMSLPDYNEPIKPMRGKLLSLGLVGLVKAMLGWKSPRMVRVFTLGIKREYRQRGIDARLFAHSVRYGLKRGFRECEVSWMLEDNAMILRPIDVFGGTKYKTYRLYERAIG